MSGLSGKKNMSMSGKMPGGELSIDQTGNKLEAELPERGRTREYVYVPHSSERDKALSKKERGERIACDIFPAINLIFYLWDLLSPLISRRRIFRSCFS